MAVEWRTVKVVHLAARIAWMPELGDPVIYLAAGTASEDRSESRQVKPELDIYSLNLKERAGERLRFHSSIPTVARFHKLIWGSFGVQGDKYARGVIIGGVDRGHIQLFNAAKVIDGTLDGHVRHLLTSRRKHCRPVEALSLSLVDPRSLASAAGALELFVWDLNVESVAAELSDERLPDGGELTCVAWNRRVSQQLASTWPNRCLIWDLRRNTEVTKIEASGLTRYSYVTWHPEKETVLSLASVSDERPVIELWDIRQTSAPFNTLEGHSRGVLTMDWCCKNSDWLLSSGKDNRVLLWQANSSVIGGELICQVARGVDHHFDVDWCPQNALFVATASRDNHVRLHTAMNRSCYSFCGC